MYKNESLYILNYINGKNIYASYGLLNNIEENKITHKCNTDTGSSGSPIILLKNNKVIGVHYGGSKYNHDFNFGTLLKKPIFEYIKINNEKNKKLNYIIAEIDIKEKDVGEDIRIISSFEEYLKSVGFIFAIEKKDYYKFENEKEIKDNCKIRINNNNINFNYYYKFKEKGKYTIEYIFYKKVTKTDFMFWACKSLININLSNFSTKSVTNMSYMFSGCNSLTNINLSNFNTQTVNNMSYMFFWCESLNNINLSNFNIQNVTNISYMFGGCKSLKNINLSNFNTQNVSNMSFMFYECESLKNINLSNFNTQRVTNMSHMFYDCNSLTNINLSNFTTQNVTNMSFMFFYCKSLKKENILTKDRKLLNGFQIK